MYHWHTRSPYSRRATTFVLSGRFPTPRRPTLPMFTFSRGRENRVRYTQERSKRKSAVIVAGSAATDQRVGLGPGRSSLPIATFPMLLG
jgi:hypothetical protein